MCMKVRSDLGWSLLAITVVLGSTLPLFAQANPAAQSQLKKVPGGRFVYLEWDGPYWQAGPTITRVKEFMASQNQKGMIQVRYPGDPSTEPASATKSIIGFMAPADCKIESPFKEVILAPADAVSLTIEGQPGVAIRKVASIKKWILSQGITPTGPVIEMVDSEVDLNKQGKIEVLVLATSPLAGSGPRAVAAEIPMESPATVNDKVTKEMWETKQYKRISELLVPETPAMNTETQTWIGQVVFRISAISKGIQVVYPDHAGDITTFADTLTNRLGKVAPNAGEEAKKQSIVRTDHRPDSVEGKRIQMVRDLDKLLSQVSTKTLSAAQVEGELRRVLAPAQDLISPTPP